MALKQLTPEQIHSMSLEEKDAWWLANVYRGDMPQLTLRAGITGMLLGGFLSLTNLYIGAKTGWSLGVGITSVILSFATFKILSKSRILRRLGIGREMTVLENNAMQSIATSAGYTNSALFTSFAAYTMVTSQIIPIYQVCVWLLIIAVIGVLFAFPMKKRFINDEQLPFPEGMAAGVVMDMLHESDEKEGLFKAKLLLVCGGVAATIELLRDEMVMRVLFAAKSIPEFWDDLLYGDGAIASWLKGAGLTPRLMGTELRELTIQWDSSIILLATGGLTGIRAGSSMLVGGVLNYFIFAPIMIRNGVITPTATGHFGFRQITMWALWGGVACMTTSSLYSFFSKPKVIIDAVRGFGKKRGPAKVDVLADIELPLKVSLIGVPFASIFLVVLGHRWFGIQPWLGIIAVPLVFVFSLIAVNSTGLTSITPTGALGKLTQLTFGALAPRNIVTNVMTAGITAEVSSNAANLLMDIKPGYMLGAKPRQQAVGHLLGAVSGLTLSVPVWYYVFIQGDVSRYGSDRLPVPSALTWKAVAELLMTGLHNLHPTAQAAVVVGALIGIAVEVSKQVTKNKFPLSAVGLGLAFVLSFHDIWAMFLGAFIFWMLERKGKRWEDAHAANAPKDDEKPAEYREPPASGSVKKPWFAIAADNTEAICAGVIAGGALMGIGINVLDVLVFPEVKEAHALAPLVKHALAALAP
jgi:OPT family oligopeptide transporter